MTEQQLIDLAIKESLAHSNYKRSEFLEVPNT